MKASIYALLIALFVSATAAAQVKSVYTSTKTGACRTIKSNPEEAGYYEGECPGVGGYKVRLIEGDLRQTLDVITPKKKRFELKFWEHFSSFSAIGEKLEWRTKAGIPFAMIARYYVADPEGGKGRSYLFVTKIGKTSACITDIVEPMAKQNEKARELADSAGDKPCLKN